MIQVKEIAKPIFGGKTADFKDENERAFEKKHLRAYLKGHTRFTHGIDKEGNKIWHRVIRINQ